MKKTYYLILVVLLSLIITATVSNGQQANIGAKIVLEEEEITQMENGKETKKIYVSKRGNEKQAILKDLEQKIYAKLGVQSHKEMSERNLVAKYNEEMNKLMRIKKLDPARLKFLDKKDNLLKEILLVSEKSKGKITETRRSYKKGEFDAEMVTVKLPVVSRQGKYAVMNNTTYADVGYSISVGKIVLYDVSGNVLFEKQFPNGTNLSSDRIVVSDIGTVAVVVNASEEGPGPENYLYAYDNSGKELLYYSYEYHKKSPSGDMMKISSNGRYLAVSVDFEQKRTVFFDLEKNLSWKADKDYVVYEISDDGTVKADYYDEIKQEASNTVMIDLAERMKP